MFALTASMLSRSCIATGIVIVVVLMPARLVARWNFSLAFMRQRYH